eukprot:TRINITY_DN3386_c0_g1_i1.p1 TRINITY_DN3386_c0_g1~~TRINITY_DN3386_c0_g1_i1.p1  ORF type:complete len:411 (-),score=53.94 TRINITY_DN3386_c0_g1_i1:110-1342(-)
MEVDYGDESAILEDRIIQNTQTGGPLKKLTVGLVDTYTHINNVYFYRQKQEKIKEAMRAATDNNGFDDECADYILSPGELFGPDDRYQMKEVLGKGSFGQVIKASVRATGEYVAIKIIKNKPMFRRQATIEIEILQGLRDKAEDLCNIVELREHFVYRNHLCLVFELLSFSLYDLLQRSHFLGISLSLVRKFAQQILHTLCYLRLPSVDVIHCDLKPENILLRHPKKSAIKVIDFGSSCHYNGRIYKYLQSRFYRSPEVILELEYGHGIDMWSCACVLVEMHTGEPLFQGMAEFDQLFEICQVIGLPPDWMIEQSPKKSRFFNLSYHPDGRRIWTLKGHREKVFRHRPLESILMSRKSADFSEVEIFKFKDLLERILIWEPGRRITPKDASEHRFFTPTSDESTTTYQGM